MKAFFTFLLFLLINSFLSAQGIPLLDVKKGGYRTEAGDRLRSDNWYAVAKEEIRKQEYNIKWKTGLEEYVAVNRKNRVGFYLNQDGYRILSFSLQEANEVGWEFNFRLNSICRSNYKFPATPLLSVEQSANHLIYHFPHYAMEFLNDTNGMRQNFIIKDRPQGLGFLEVNIDLEGDLQTSIENGKKLLLSSSKNGKSIIRMQYDQLKVWDRNHKLLDAQMRLNDDGKTLTIAVNDAQAMYPVTIDPLNHIPSWTSNGMGILPSLDVLYGMSVSDAGDVNNDGYDDIIIGAPGNIDVLSGSVIASTGQAFIYLGSPSGPSATPDIVLQSSSVINSLFGYCVSSAGDINNDGYDDVIVGAPGDQATLNFGIPFGSLTNTIGKVYVYYGNAAPVSVAGSVVSINLRTSDFNPVTFGLSLNPLYGYSVSSAGDVNNDGYSDIIVGSPLYTDLGTLTAGGRATIYLGSATGLNTASPIHRNGGLLSNALFGFSVSSAGDMNNDGADEVLIGAPGALSLLPGLAGRAFVYTGINAPASGGISSGAVTYTDGGLLKALFGFSVSNAGDINNDGYDDIVVGQPATLSLDGLVTVGKASIFYGSASLSNKSTDDISLVSPRDPDILGLVNGNLLFGFSVSGGKDLNCDGIADVIIGEPGGTGLLGLSGVNAVGGQAYIYYGRNGIGPNSEAGWELKETDPIVVANLLGYSVSIAGDVNGDGKNEILVGAANGTLNLTNILTGVINFAFVQSIGSAYVHNGCILPTFYTLPVKMDWFKGYLQDRSVILEWQTASEQYAHHFEVERSSDGIHFERIGVVNAKGESDIPTEYSFTDMTPVNGNNIYRIKMVDKDAKFSYSTVIAVRMESKGFVHLRSTLVQTEFVIEFNRVPKGEYLVDLISMDGRILQRNMERLSADWSTRTITIKSLPARGIYMVNIRRSGSQEHYREKIIIQ